MRSILFEINTDNQEQNTSLVKLYNPIPKNFSELVLIAVNLIPLIGMWFWGWKLADLFILYWSESLIIAFFWYAKIIATLVLNKAQRPSLIRKIPGYIFFTIHFGGFMFGHLFFIISFFVLNTKTMGFGESVKSTLDNLSTIAIPFVLIFISHGLSFIQNFIIKKEYLKWSQKSEIGLPYGRIITMHFSVFLIAFLINSGKFLSPLSSILIIITKIITDLRAHRKERIKYR